MSHAQRSNESAAIVHTLYTMAKVKTVTRGRRRELYVCICVWLCVWASFCLCSCACVFHWRV